MLKLVVFTHHIEYVDPILFSNILAMTLKLNAVVDGENASQTVIILHGLFGSTSNWRSISRQLSKSYQVISLDLRNHGNSPWSDSMKYEEIAGDVQQYITDNKITNPNIIGHSMGGKTAMTLIQNFDLGQGKVFVIDIAPVAYTHNHDGFINAMQSIDFDLVKTRNDVDRLLQQHIPEVSFRQFLMQNLTRDQEKFGWRINLHSIEANMKHIMGYEQDRPVENKLVFIAGDQSNYILSEHHDVIKTHFPHSVIETVADAGHWLHAEKPDVLLEIILKYLN